jgi:IMP cyclohydrolase
VSARGRESLAALAKDSFARHLSANPYPGRGLVMGRAEADDAWLQIYWIMGRSENSRNRVFVAAGGELRTAPADPARVADPSLIFYEAMLELPGMICAFSSRASHSRS